MDDGLLTFKTIVSFFYDFLELKGNYFGYELSFMDILIGSFLVGLVFYFIFRILE